MWKEKLTMIHCHVELATLPINHHHVCVCVYTHIETWKVLKDLNLQLQNQFDNLIIIIAQAR